MSNRYNYKLGIGMFGNDPHRYPNMDDQLACYSAATLDDLIIKEKEELEAEQRAQKEKSLAKVKECLAKDLAEVEKLSKELGL